LNKQFLLDVASEHGCKRTVKFITELGLGSYPAVITRQLSQAWQESNLTSLIAITVAANEFHNASITANDSKTFVDAAVKALEDASGSDRLYSGALEKKRGKNDWKGRWCVVTSSEILYYAKEGDNIPKGSVPLAGCVIRRYPDDNHTFEILAPNIVVKKTLFGAEKCKAMLFRAKSEGDYNNWISVLRAVTGSIAMDNRAAVRRLAVNPTVLSLLLQTGATSPNQAPPSSLADLQPLATSYWLDICKQSTDNVFWSNVNVPRTLPFLAGYTYLRLSVLFHHGPEIGRYVTSHQDN
jgi:hypothetical protein